MSAVEAIQQLVKFKPDLQVKAVDVGAANRKYLLPSSLRSHVALWAIEPDRESWAAEREQAGYAFERWYDIAIAGAEGLRDFFRTRKRELSSLRRPNLQVIGQFPDSLRFEIVDKARVQVTTLDSALNMMGCEYPDHIKIDVQGCTYESLQGAAKALESAIVVQFEAEMLPIYRGQRLVEDCLKLLRRRGFEVLDMRPVYWLRKHAAADIQTKGQLIFYNVLACRRPASFLHSSLDTLCKFIFLLLAYGYVDLALQVLARVRDARNDLNVDPLIENICRALEFRSEYFGAGSVQEWATP